MSGLQLSFVVREESEMEAAAAVFARRSRPPLSIGLRGDLGSGKTVFCRGYIRACGYRGVVRSPTYTLLEEYSGKNFSIFHFDFYRLSDSGEFENLGGRDCYAEDSVRLFEWAERIPSVQVDLMIAIEFAGARRRLKLTARTQAGEKLIRAALQPLALIGPQRLANKGMHNQRTELP